TEFTDLGVLTGATLQKKKYGAFHRVTINVRKNLQFSFVEAVIFDRQDSTETGRFDWNYLNPVIFYRSLEQGLGSRDNALIGLEWKWMFHKHCSFYGQFVLDEFKLKEFKQGGWWANKWAFQSGLKYMNVAGIKNLDLLGEVNIVRPFTYSHFRSGGNYM